MSRIQLRRATGLSGEVARAPSDARSMASKFEIGRFVPRSKSSKFAAVRPRIGLPARSTTVTGTSTR